jgi:RHH-type proline utilization regulon transcriptional repressor/proline dehydrogenase/delta 1-pyrroline-5-carboxylate dehydrogenase
VIDWLAALAASLDRRIMVRLVKGAYWDTEIKRAQVEGVDGFPVFTRKAATDVSYLACARKLLRRDRPALSAIRHAQRPHHRRDPPDGREPGDGFEFQRLHGMGEALHEMVRRTTASPAASTRRWGGTATSWPISCGGCWRTAPTRPS